jgi:hypothetical protein
MVGCNRRGLQISVRTQSASCGHKLLDFALISENIYIDLKTRESRISDKNQNVLESKGLNHSAQHAKLAMSIKYLSERILEYYVFHK